MRPKSQPRRNQYHGGSTACFKESRRRPYIKEANHKYCLPAPSLSTKHSAQWKRQESCTKKKLGDHVIKNSIIWWGHNQTDGQLYCLAQLGVALQCYRERRQLDLRAPPGHGCSNAAHAGSAWITATQCKQHFWGPWQVQGLQSTHCSHLTLAPITRKKWTEMVISYTATAGALAYFQMTCPYSRQRNRSDAGCWSAQEDAQSWRQWPGTCRGSCRNLLVYRTWAGLSLLAVRKHTIVLLSSRIPGKQSELLYAPTLFVRQSRLCQGMPCSTPSPPTVLTAQQRSPREFPNQSVFLKLLCVTQETLNKATGN